eukprot:Trichotokara_eunicae@DN5094_c0_g1_i2.p1
MWRDERDRMIYVSWLPRVARAGERGEKRARELHLKKFITERLGFDGLEKVLLFPPSSAHCKLIFQSEEKATRFLAVFGGFEGAPGPTLWKQLVCEQLKVQIRNGIKSTRVKVIWADHGKNIESKLPGYEQVMEEINGAANGPSSIINPASGHLMEGGPPSKKSLSGQPPPPSSTVS